MILKNSTYIMRTFFLSLCLVFINYDSIAQNDSLFKVVSNKFITEHFLKELNLKGHVITITENNYLVNDKLGGIQKGALQYKFIKKFDMNGYLTEQSWKSKDQYYKSIYKYSDNTDFIEENTYQLDGSLSNRKTYKYDNKGNQIECKSYNSDGSSTSKTIYEYDNNGIKIEEKNYYSDVRFPEVTIYKSDDKGNYVEINSFHSDGSLSYKLTYTYDNKDNIIEGNSFKSDGSLRFKTIKKYDDKGNIIEENRNGSFYARLTTSYEKEDNFGNWISNINYSENKPISISEREIIYY